MLEAGVATARVWGRGIGAKRGAGAELQGVSWKHVPKVRSSAAKSLSCHVVALPRACDDEQAVHEAFPQCSLDG